MPTPPLPDDREADRRTLARWRWYARAAMVATLAVALGLYAVPEPRPYWIELTQAAAKAGFVGAVADWFAVNALFRYPFGPLVPVGALLPRQKRRLAGGMGRFVARQFFTPDNIHRAVQGIDTDAVRRTTGGDWTALRSRPDPTWRSA